MNGVNSSGRQGVEVLLQDLKKAFGDVIAVNSVNITIKPGEFLTLLGPSGSGKTTILKLVAGFEDPNQGSIIIDNEDITAKPPYHRNIGMVFQNYALFPHMNVYDNIAFPLKMRKVNRHNIAGKVKDVLNLVKLSGLEHRYPRQLSGGQQQRVALARALVYNPKLFLMDEPLGALDKKLREQMQIELRRLQQELNITTINVTHDQEEALTLSERIAVLNDGNLEQVGTPSDIYDRPVNKFVADFIGESNFFNLSLTGMEAQQISCCTVGGTQVVIETGPKVFKKGEALEAMIRPEKVELVTGTPLPDNCFNAVVGDIVYLGSDIRCRLVLEGGEEIIAKWSGPVAGLIRENEKVRVGWSSRCMRLV